MLDESEIFVGLFQDKRYSNINIMTNNSICMTTDDYEEFAKYIDVYERGMKEVKTFLLK